MKILDIPQAGKRGLNVSQKGRYGQISRALVIPSNPQTPAQMTVRAIFGSVARAWDGLTEAQRLAWIAAGSTQQTRSRLGQSGPMTGLQLFLKLNATLEQFGGERVDAPPALPVFAANAVQNVAITNTAGVIAIKLTVPGDPGTNTIVRATAPQAQGIAKSANYRILGTCPVPVQGSADITAMYANKFGTPPVGTKIFVTVNQYQNGYQSPRTSFAAIVPAS